MQAESRALRRGRLLSIAGAALLSFSGLGCAAAQDAGNHSATEQGEHFLPSDDPVAEVNTLLSRAAQEHRLALIVLGANWCHDSRALASRLQEAPLGAVAAKHYATLFVDVGYLEHGKDVMNRFDLPVFYATPTVLIIDPSSGQLVNADDRHQWGAAYSIGMEASVEYFERMANRAPVTEDPAEGSELQGLLDAIRAYEDTLAERVEQGYARVGPMLRAYKEGGEVPDSFDDDWQEVSEFRNAIPAAIEALRAKASRRVAAGERGIRLEFPEIPPFSWQESPPVIDG